MGQGTYLTTHGCRPEFFPGADKHNQGPLPTQTHTEPLAERRSAPRLSRLNEASLGLFLLAPPHCAIRCVNLHINIARLLWGEERPWKRSGLFCFRYGLSGF